MLKKGRYVAVLISLFACVVSCAWVYLHTAHPLYKLSARFRFVPSEASNQSKENEGTSTSLPQRTLDDDLAILGSPELLNLVANDPALAEPGSSKSQKEKLITQLSTIHYQSEPADDHDLSVSFTYDNLSRGKKIIKNFIKNAVLLSRKKNTQVSKINFADIGEHLSTIENRLLHMEQLELENSPSKRILESKVDNAQAVYTSLLEEKERSALILVEQNYINAQLNKAQVTYTVIKPDEMSVYLLSVGVGMTLWLAFLGSIKISKFRSKPVQLHHGTNLPVIHEPAEARLSDRRHTIRSGITNDKQFKKLRNALILKSTDHKKILVTSAVSREGKSFIASNLAKSIASTGKRTVLIDFDFKLQNPFEEVQVAEQGISEFLNGDLSIESIVHSCPEKELFYIPAGKNPARKLEGEARHSAEQLFKSLQQSFDYIIINGAPVWPDSDAYYLSELCDTTLFIISHAYRPNVLIERMNSFEQLAGLTNAAIVFNDVSDTRNTSTNHLYSFDHIFEN